MPLSALLVASLAASAPMQEDVHARIRRKQEEARRRVRPVITAYPQPPRPEPARPATAASAPAPAPTPVGDPSAWVDEADLPVNDVVTGTVRVRLYVDVQGRPANCSTVRSLAPTLDRAVCDLLLRRARFEPARDARGDAVPSNWERSIRWRSRADLDRLAPRP